MTPSEASTLLFFQGFKDQNAHLAEEGAGQKSPAHLLGAGFGVASPFLGLWTLGTEYVSSLFTPDMWCLGCPEAPCLFPEKLPGRLSCFPSGL